MNLCTSKVDKIIGVEDTPKSMYATINGHNTNTMGPVHCSIKRHDINTVEPVPFPVDQRNINAVDSAPFAEDRYNTNAVGSVSSRIKETQATTRNYLYTAVVIKNKSMVIADSDTTGHFLQIQNNCVDKQRTIEGLQVELPDGSIITSTHTALLDIPQLPMKTRRAHLFPNITHILLSISMLCDQGYIAIFDDKHMYIIKNVKVLLHGNRDSQTNLYIVNLYQETNTAQPKLNVKHMENLGEIRQFTNNAYELKVKNN